MAGLFERLFGYGSQGEGEPNTVYAPLAGKVIPLEEIGDGVFSEGILGNGCGLIPSVDKAVAPFNGTVTQIADTKHAIGLISDSGIELLLHIGMDTVNMKGQGFHVPVSVGQKVKRGQLLMSFDRSAIQKAGFSIASAIVIVNTDAFSVKCAVENDSVRQGAVLLRVEKNPELI